MHRKHTLGLLPSGRAVFDTHTHVKAAGSKPVPKAAAWDG